MQATRLQTPPENMAGQSDLEAKVIRPATGVSIVHTIRCVCGENNLLFVPLPRRYSRSKPRSIGHDPLATNNRRRTTDHDSRRLSATTRRLPGPAKDLQPLAPHQDRRNERPLWRDRHDTPRRSDLAASGDACNRARREFMRRPSPGVKPIGKTREPRQGLPGEAHIVGDNLLSR